MFRRKRRCQNLCPSAHPAYYGRQCELSEGHERMCRASSGPLSPFKHYWDQEFYERLGKAITK